MYLVGFKVEFSRTWRPPHVPIPTETNLGSLNLGCFVVAAVFCFPSETKRIYRTVWQVSICISPRMEAHIPLPAAARGVPQA